MHRLVLLGASAVIFLAHIFLAQLTGARADDSPPLGRRRPPLEQAPSAAARRPPLERTSAAEPDQPAQRRRGQGQRRRQEDPGIELDSSLAAPLRWRSIGPASMGGRIVDLEVVESDPSTFYVATASGGLFKTVNNGTTFAPVFDRQATVSIGDVAVCPAEPNVVWVGTGEHNPRNSVSWGDGVYRSTDGGKNWEHVGLKDSYQIGRIAVHPTNPEIAYVGALGRLWGPSQQRGLYKTTDGGRSWQRVLFVDDKTGCVEVAMHPRDPDTLLAAMYERQRGPYDVGDPVKRWGPGSGIYKTTDGGANWKTITQGLPQRPLGRIGIAYYRGDPNTVYSIVESDKIGDGPAQAFMGIQGGQRVPNARIQGVVEGGPAEKAGLQANDVVIQIDDEKIETYEQLVLQIRAHKPDDTVNVKVQRGDKQLDLKLTFAKRQQGSRRPFTSYLGGQAANAQNRQGPKGNDTGGVYKSTDGGESWKRINSLNPRPFYYSQIRVDPSDDQFLYVLGVSFHFSTDNGRQFQTSARSVHPDHHALWIDPRDGRHLILGCDGGLYVSYDRGQTWDFHNIMAIGQFYDVGVDTRSPYRVYGGLQDNGSWGGPSRKRGRAGPDNGDWLRIGGGDGFVCRPDPQNPHLVYYESQYGRMARVDVRSGERASIRPPQAPRNRRWRFNWKTPFILSPHNSRIFYCAGNVVFRSLNQGRNLQAISPVIAATERGSATALAESPLEPGVLYVGTDDGALWVTRDGGHQWDEITKRVGLAGPYQVTSIEPSKFARGRVYVAFDGHRSDNDDPHLYVTEDYGRTWKAIHEGLPSGSTHCLREDAQNRNLLFCGSEFAVWASLDRGAHWTKINNNLPTVAVHEIAVHPTQNEIVAATHGRSLWLLDITPLRQMSSQVARQQAHLFQPSRSVLWAGALSSSRSGNRLFAGQNPSFGATLFYRLKDAAKEASLEIFDVRGTSIRKLEPETEAGLHRVQWDLRRALPPGRGRNRPRLGSPVAAGSYLVKLTVDGQQFTQELQVEADPEFPRALLTEELEEHTRAQRPTFIE